VKLPEPQQEVVETPAPVVAKPPPVVKPKKAQEPKAISSARESNDAPAPLQTLGVSDDRGLSVAGQVGAAPAVAASSLTGVQGGTGTGAALDQPARDDAHIDLRKLTAQWASEVSRAISARAIREYPRAALRARLTGTVLLRVSIDEQGTISAVEVLKSSGVESLDTAAAEAAKALGAVPAPPKALHRYLRPFPVPVNYVIR